MKQPRLKQIKCRASLCVVFASFLIQHILFAQKSDVAPNERLVPSPEVGTGGDFPFRSLRIGLPALRYQKIESDEFNDFVPGMSTMGRLALNPVLHTPYAHIPYLRRGDSLETGDVVIGRILSLDIALGSSFIFTDNAYRQSEKTSDLIIQTLLSLSANLQLTENFQLSTSGNLAYYRAMGQDDISVYGFRDEFYFNRSLDFDPETEVEGNVWFASQFDWSRQMGAWGFGLADRFTVTERLMSEPFVDGRLKQTTELANVAWASIGRVLPTQSRTGLLLRHGDYWYQRDFKQWNRANDEATLWFVVDRDTARLKPFAEYSIKSVRYSRGSSRDTTVHRGHLGIFGEVTDQLNAKAAMGYGRDSSGDAESLLWNLTLDHLMNSRTREQLLLSRYLADSGQASQSTDDSIQYRIGRMLGRDFTVWLGFSKFRHDPQGSDTVTTRNWSMLSSISRGFARNWNASLQYEHVDWKSSASDNNFNENRITLNIVWNRDLNRQKDIGILPPLDHDVKPRTYPEFDL